uniref:Uncharacterized protein n=1 Tax=viral metagenome TaxID=1070528 RepID=A0A6H1ZNC2_9ZZZZ
MPREAKYRCKHCGRVLLRRSTKQWIANWCYTTGRDVHLMRLKPRKPRKHK